MVIGGTLEVHTFHSRGVRVLRAVATVGIALVVALLCAWTTLAIYYSNLPGQILRTLAAVAFPLGTVVAYAMLPRRGRTTAYFFGGFALILVWWLMIPASHEREWAPEYAMLPSATVDGDLVTIHNVRNFDYRTADDFTIAYEDRTYDLSELDTVDFFLSYWDGNRDIAHTLISFGFGGKDWLTLSIETRREATEGYSTIAGFFKQFELIYILADERDLIRLRTNFRGEDVYLYPMKYTREQAVGLFRNVVQRVNAVVDQPEWYNALEHNCTTALIPLADGIREMPFQFDMRMIRNGWIDQMGFERGQIPADDTDQFPYEEMRAAHAITAIAQPYRDDPEYSRKIRAQLPKRTR